MSGTSGSSGSSGNNGQSGLSRTSGTNGSSGNIGTSGVAGTSGSSGGSGTSGQNGAGGTSGANGTSGSSGTPGTSGTSINGTSGISGGAFVNSPNYLVRTDSSTTVQSVPFLYTDITNTRLGINDTSPSYRLDVNGNAQITTDLYLGNRIYHSGDTNTFIGFNTLDEFQIYCGGVLMLQFVEGINDYFYSQRTLGLGPTVPDTNQSLHIQPASGTGALRVDNAGGGVALNPVGPPDTQIGSAGPPNEFLGPPDVWLIINVSGTDYQFPGYL